MHLRALLVLLVAAPLAACSSADGDTSSFPAGDDGGTLDDTDGTGDDGGTPGDDTGSGTKTDTGSGTADTAPLPDPPPVPGAVYGAKCGTMSADDLKAWQDIAIVRGKAKMGALDCIDTIQKASNAHANYMQLNGGLTHQEVSGKAGFTGVNFWDRMKAAGFTGPGGAMFEVIHSLGDGHGAILGESGWINTLYHRIPFVSYGAKGFGFGNNTGKWATVDFSSGGATPSATAVSTWPVDGDTAVWTTFRCASEIPNPLPGQTYAGYPISLTGAKALAITEHVITQGTTTVDHAFLTKATDGAGLVPDSQVYLIPKTPLLKSTRYDVKVSGTVGGAAFSQAWSFVTGTK